MHTFKNLVELSRENYSNYGTTEKTLHLDGEQVEIICHWVGRNATHDFGLAELSDGRILRICCGEAEELDEDGYPTIEWNHQVIDPSRIGYIGHW